MYPGERFNSITHLIGAVLAVAGTGGLIAVAAVRGGTWQVAALAAYGLMLVFLYVSSTLYHSLPPGPAKNLFHIFDHCAIYLLIAGTYTPFTLITLGGTWGWWIFGIVWTLAIIGLAKDILFHGRYRALSVVLYVLMGWLIVTAYVPLKAALPPAGVAWLIGGGIIYTVGIAFFAMSKRVAYTHGIWHLFALGGSICHYIAVMRYVVLA
ncbi:MAG TPA: hemolysin III family protein [Thermoanaerobaculia bacterium]|jgi:hemolysin III|nr:hemolysin III family protein [Thermoanaerobaculia bacterium]